MVPIPKVCGIETEFGISHLGVLDADPIFASTLLVNAYVHGNRIGWDFVDETPGVDARGVDHQPFSPVETTMSNAVLANGSRFYVDHAHPEYSTPECRTPREALLADVAGERILIRAMELANRNLPDGESIVVYKNNSDGKSNSYGCHENYLMDRAIPFDAIVGAMLPWFVSRQIFCGAGKVGSEHGAPWTEFQISQRADFFEESVGLETTLKRPIINTRDEPHADLQRYRRLHVIAGDANCSQVATLLKIGTTAMVLVLLEAGRLDDIARLRDPVLAVRAVSHDPELQITIELENGSRCTALDLQWKYFQRAKEYASSESFAEVAPEPEISYLLNTWETVLTNLERDPGSLVGVLDWVTKRHLMNGFIERDSLEPNDPKLALIDLQYHDLRPGRSLYQRLVKSGTMTNLLAEPEILKAMTDPPESTRAYFRGKCIQRWPDAVVSANWDSIVLDTGTNPLRRIPMMDPLKGTRKHVESLFEECSTPLALVHRLNA
jgi:proteasome accessory factor PafA2